MRIPILIAASLSLLLLSLFATPALAEEAQKPSKPNVLFIAIDDLKPMLGCYGDEMAITPAIDRLAASGTVFKNAQCQFPVCGGSRASLMTGLRPESTGVMDLKTNMRSRNPKVISLPEWFVKNGYTSTGVGKIYDPRCVDSKKLNDALSWSIPFHSLPHSKLKHEHTDEVLSSVDVEDNELTDGYIALQGVKLLKQLSADDDQPFFLAVGFKKPHLPFVAPKKYWDLYDPAKIQLAIHQDKIVNGSGYSIHDSTEFRGYGGVPKTGPFSEELQRKSIHGYLACVSFVDAQVDLLLTELKRSGLDENTMVVLWGDHGFHLGDHGMFGKHTTLEQATRVPLIIRAANHGTPGSTTAPAELVDVYPTLCELAGIEIPSSIEGRSLLPIIAKKQTQTRQGALTVFKNRGAYGYSFRTQRYRYTEWINEKFKTVASELFDYQSDPLETTNLADDPQHKDLIQELAQQLRDHGQGCGRLLGVGEPPVRVANNAEGIMESSPKPLTSSD